MASIRSAWYATCSGLSVFIYLLAALFVAHGVAHLVGFAVPWQLVPPDATTLGTTVLGGRIDLGETGSRAAGMLWLLLAIGCAAVAVAIALGAGWAIRAGFVVTAISLGMCLMFLPGAKWGVLANVAIAVFLSAAAVQQANDRWRRESDALRAGMESAVTARSQSAVPPPAAGPAPADLPAPVASYLEHVLPAGQRQIRTALIRQEAEFFLAMGKGAWQPLTATQTFTVSPPGFVWDARIRMAPFVEASVRDAYVDGRASMVGSAMGIVPLVDLQGSSELAAGALMRFLGEAVWFPTALAPGSGVRWEALDDHSARATLSDGEATVSLEFLFNDQHEVVQVFAPDRYREVAWELPEGWQPYWRGRISAIDYGY